VSSFLAKFERQSGVRPCQWNLADNPESSWSNFRDNLESSFSVKFERHWHVENGNKGEMWDHHHHHYHHLHTNLLELESEASGVLLPGEIWETIWKSVLVSEIWQTIQSPPGLILETIWNPPSQWNLRDTDMLRMATREKCGIIISIIIISSWVRRTWVVDWFGGDYEQWNWSQAAQLCYPQVCKGAANQEWEENCCICAQGWMLELYWGECKHIPSIYLLGAEI